ncbi:hypothetical protein DPEC_G00302410 [Dallia pectoralis]|uniref:Uncharacterized protein n=1 Tax=Dallia pectoralis TaxID=75939 RepID=A0ACC2FH62_DALPE|nr:hypothetical protein DPEC_G00302410 [Dallia pectoralis]
MKTLILTTVLLLLVCSSQVHSLSCFTCDPNNPENCKVVTQCPPSSQYCRTVVTATTVARSCEEMCDPGVNIYCCQGDLCEN